MAKIGFVGLGHMGGPMAINLVQAGHEVFGYDLDPNAMAHFQLQGGSIATSLSDVARDKEIVITMLQTGKQVFSVTCGEEGLFKSASLNALYIDCSTIDVATTREVSRLAVKQGIDMVDAPVSGGVAGAKAKTLTFMVGGSECSFLRAKPFLLEMGKNVIHTGDLGTGEAAKICNNMILGVSMIAVSEAFILAERLGLSLEKLHEVVSSASGQCWVMDHYVPVKGILPNVPANHDYEPGFSAQMMLKDLSLSQEAAKAAHLHTAMGEAAMVLYQQLVEAGLGEKDFSVIIQSLSKSYKG